MTDASEWENVGVQTPTDILTQLNNKADELRELAEYVVGLEENLKAAKAALHSLRTIEMPGLMLQTGQSSFVRNGTQFKIKDLVSGSLPKDPEKRARALEELKRLDAESLLKTEVSVTFGRSQHNEANDVYQSLLNEGHLVTMESGVHPQTLTAFVRQRLENGEPVDPEALGVFVGKTVEIKSVKK